MPRENFKRIDQFIENRGIVTQNNGCYKIDRSIEQFLDRPARYAIERLDSLLSGDYLKATSYLDPNKLLFLDLETTGLGYDKPIWLIGILTLENGRLTIPQLLARDIFEEERILKKFAEYMATKPYWISFNGGTFDTKRLEKRSQACMLPSPKFEKHIDIFPIYKKLKRKRLRSVKLSELEKILFGGEFKRENHIEGADIPKAYRGYLNGGDPRPVFNAIEHNAQDLITLFDLYLQL